MNNSRFSQRGSMRNIYPLKTCYRVLIRVDGTKHHIGTFATIKEAKSARDQAETDMGRDLVNYNWEQKRQKLGIGA